MAETLAQQNQERKAKNDQKKVTAKDMLKSDIILI